MIFNQTSRKRVVSGLIGLALFASAATASASGKAFGQLKTLAGDKALAAVPLVAASHRQSPRAQSHPERDGRDSAARVCRSAAFDSDKNKCLEIVSQGDYFDAAAVAACGKLAFSSSIPQCMAAIQDKTYVSEIVRGCAENAFDSGKITCLERNGRRYRRGRGGNAQILRRLRDIEYDLERRDIVSALFNVRDLIRFVKRGGHRP